jgi:aspartate/methionine/tyrosine aminotransferase
MAYPLFLTRWLIRTGLARFLPGVRRLTDGGGDFLRYYSNRLLAAPHEELRQAACLLEPPGADTIDLTAGAPRFDLLPSAGTKLPADRRGYPPPWGLPELREAVAARLYAERRLAVRPADEVLITHGAAGAFSAALDTFVNRGDPVVLFDPASPLFAFALKHRRAKIRWLSSWAEDGRLRFRLDHLARALHRARLIVLNSPANPTGAVIAPEDLEQIAWWADRNDVLIFSDEVFGRYQFEGEPVSIGVLPKAQRRTLTTSGVSKGYALASARVGWLAGHRHLVRPCAVTAALQAPFVPTLCQQIALAALEQGDAPFAPVKAEFESRRRYAFERLQAVGLKPVWPAGAFFVWVPVHGLGLDGRAFADKLLQLKKVLVWPGHFFGPSGAGYIRISYAVEDGRLREGLARLAELIRELQTPPGSVAEVKRAA